MIVFVFSFVVLFGCRYCYIIDIDIDVDLDIDIDMDILIDIEFEAASWQASRPPPAAKFEKA